MIPGSPSGPAVDRKALTAGVQREGIPESQSAQTAVKPQ